MSKVILFSGHETLNALETRAAMIRIPEVSARLKSAQVIVDSQCASAPLLLNYMLVEDEWFQRDGDLRSLIVALVQAGLLDRFKKSNQLPEYFIGISGADSVLRLVTDFWTADLGHLAKWIENTNWGKKQKLAPVSPVPSAALDISPSMLPMGRSSHEICLSRGFTQTELELVRAKSDGGLQIKVESLFISSDVCQMIRYLGENENVSQIVNIGPSHYLTDQIQDSPLRESVRVVNSIELDPMLTWLSHKQSAHPSFYYRA